MANNDAYIEVDTKEYPVTSAEIVQRHPNTIFPTPFVPPGKYALVQPSAPPAHDSFTQKCVESTPVKVEGVWVQQWAVANLTEQELAEMLPQEVTQFEKDQSRYQKRAAVKDALMAYMAADNMRRVRNGQWTVNDLTLLLDDPAVVAANSLMGTLSFELAAQQIQSATTELLTPEIKTDWVSRLQSHYYLEG